MTKPTAYRVAKRIERQFPHLSATVIVFQDDEDSAPYWIVYCVTKPQSDQPMAAYSCADGRTLHRIGDYDFAQSQPQRELVLQREGATR
jgi:hypothetical protein